MGDREIIDLDDVVADEGGIIELEEVVDRQSGTTTHEIVRTSAAIALSPPHPPINEIIAQWLSLDVANGDARADTINTYRCHFQQWMDWCDVREIPPMLATPEHVKLYRKFLVDAGSAHDTITLKLTTVRRFYQAAVDRKILQYNPAMGIKAPRDRAPKDDIVFLTQEEAVRLLQSVPRDGELRHKRDLAIIVFMLLEGMRRVEIERANDTDVVPSPKGGYRILAHGKGKDDWIYPREDCLNVLNEYLKDRGPVRTDDLGSPMFVKISKSGNPIDRLSRNGINWITVHYLEKAGLKKDGSACHGLRHTCGFLLYDKTNSIKVVQETLRHSQPSTAARYSHVKDRATAKYTEQIELKI